VSRSQGIAPGATKAGSDEKALSLAQMVLVSRESCQVARTVPLSSGLGLKKCVMISLSAIVEQGGLRREQCKGEAGGGTHRGRCDRVWPRQADVITIEWVNNAKVLHSVDADPSMAQHPQDVELPKGVKPFDSGFMPPGATYGYTFTIPGTYKYTCVPLEKDAMNGTIVVKK
jgi:Copper binding proteins, plastocyanin/azurin family